MRALWSGIFLFLASLCFAAPGPFRIQISPANGTVISNQTQQLTATGRFLAASGGGRNLTNTVTWQSSDQTVATVSASGLVTPVALGTVTITAHSGPFRGSTHITVIPNLAVNSVAVTPANPSIPNGLNQQFVATATYSDNSTQDVTAAATWGSTAAAVATIDASGLARSHTPGTATISANFGGQNGSTLLTVTVPVVTSIQVTPATITLPIGGTQQFTAIGTLNNGTSQDITATATWNSTVPSEVAVSSSGLATGLALGGPVTINAMKDAATGSATVTAVAFTNANLNGQYAFSFLGSIPNFQLVGAGTMQADGQGHISSGVIDLNDFTSVIQNQPFTGTYTVGPDGRGTAVITGSVNTTFKFVLTASGQGVIAQFDNVSVSSGLLTKQDPSAFHTATLNTSFAFLLRGVGTDPSSGNEFPVGVIGQLNLDGAGNIPGGQVEINDSGNYSGVMTPGGTYSVAANGRGVMTVHDNFGDIFNFALYVVSNKRVLLVELDPDSQMVGVADRQTGGLGNAALNGNYVFAQSGVTSTDGFTSGFVYFSAGVMPADGAGNISNGVIDINDHHLGIFEALVLSGTYSANSTGRGTATLTDNNGTFHYVFYQVSPTTTYLLSTDSFAVLSGKAEQQAAAAYSASSLKGNFSLQLNDDLFAGTAISGQFVADGSGNLNGTEDENSFGNLFPNIPLSGIYTVESTGRGTAAIHSTIGGVDHASNFHFYLINGNELRFVQIDAASRLLGGAEKQF
jgi:hypothetical protein